MKQLKQSTIDQLKKPENEEVMTWEHIDEMRQDIVKNLQSQKILLDGLVESAKDELDKDENLSRVIVGMYNSFGDVAKKVQVVQAGHLVTDEEGYKVPRTGNIDIESDDLHTAMGIVNNYTNLGEQIAELSTIGFTDVFSSLKAKGYDINQKDINKATRVYMEGMKDLMYARMGQTPPKKETRAKAKLRRKSKKSK